MANESVPQEPVVEQPGMLEIVKEVLGEISLPKMIAGAAGEAISRLIAGGADIPAAWLYRFPSLCNATLMTVWCNREGI